MRVLHHSSRQAMRATQSVERCRCSARCCGGYDDHAAVHGKKRCRMHGGAAGSGAPRANQNARKHGLFTKNAIAERRQIQALLGDARKLLEEMK